MRKLIICGKIYGPFWITHKSVPVTAPDLNLSPFAHETFETSSLEGTKGGKFTEVYCMDISFLQLPSHIFEQNGIQTYQYPKAN